MLTQLIYSSQPFGFDDAMLGGILRQARRNNTRDGVTGALICRHDLYLQMLEGDAEPIAAVFARIAVDDRHLSPVLRWSATGGERQFGGWAMRDDPARSWLWSAREVAAGALDAAPPEAVRGVFARLAADAPSA